MTPTTSTTEVPVIDRGNTDPTCRRSNTFYNREQPCVGELLFEEQFNQALSDRWRVVKQFSGTPVRRSRGTNVNFFFPKYVCPLIFQDYEFVVYQDENVSVKDGELRIKPTPLENLYEDQFVRRGNLIITGSVHLRRSYFSSH